MILLSLWHKNWSFCHKFYIFIFHSLNFCGLLGASIKVSQENMVTNLQAELVPLSLGNGTGFVHRGFQARLWNWDPWSFEEWRIATKVTWDETMFLRISTSGKTSLIHWLWFLIHMFLEPRWNTIGKVGHLNSQMHHLCRRPIWPSGKTSCRSHWAKREGLFGTGEFPASFHATFLFLDRSELDPFFFAATCPGKGLQEHG